LQVLKKDSLEKKRKSSFSELTGPQALKVGRSELAATSAPVQDEAIQAVLGMNPNTSKQAIFIFLFPCPGFFYPSFLPQSFPLLPISAHFALTSIARAQESLSSSKL
jgi:hypothetical protein